MAIPRISKKKLDKLIVRVQDWTADSAAMKARISGNAFEEWDRNEQAYDGSLSDFEAGFEFYHPKVQQNFLQARVDIIVSTMIGERPRITFEPVESSDELTSTIVEKCHENDWAFFGCDRELRASAHDGVVVGTGIIESSWEPVSRRVRHARLDPRALLVDNRSNYTGHTAEFMIKQSLVPLYKMGVLFPELLAEEGRGVVGGDVQVIDIGEYLPNPGFAWREPPVGDVSYPSQRRRALKANMPLVVVSQVWVRNIGAVDLFLDNEMVRRIKKDDTRSLVLTFAGDRLLRVAKGYKNNQFPFNFIRGRVRNDNFWGRDDVKAALPSQIYLNMLMSRIVHWTQLSVNPQWVLDENVGGMIGSEILPIPGLVHRVRGGPSALQPLRWGDLPSSALAVHALILGGLDDIMGTQEQVRGKRPKGIEAARAIEALTEAFRNRMQPRIDDLALTMKGIGSFAADLMLEKLTPEDVARRAGKQYGDDWKKIKRTAVAGFDVKPQVGTGIEQDAETVTNAVVQMFNLHAYDPEVDPRVRIKLFRAMRRFLPDADEEIALLEKMIDEMVTDEAGAGGGSPGGGGEGEAAIEGGAPVDAGVLPPEQGLQAGFRPGGQ